MLAAYSRLANKTEGVARGTLARRKLQNEYLYSDTDSFLCILVDFKPQGIPIRYMLC